MKIGLFFGSFNPIHIGHLIIANHLVEHTDLLEVWFVVTPHNPHKKKSTLLDDYQRLHMVRLATESYHKIKGSDIEFKLPQPNYTIHTLAHLEDKFPQHEFSLIMGADNLSQIHSWKNGDLLLERYSIYVYPRVQDTDINRGAYPTSVHWVDAPIIELSATQIRSMLREGKNIRPLVPLEVFDYLEKNAFYRK
ncbi:nicotinate (nicotinamide) nucleotide adenylyltransferase [Flavobacterium aurantiibacter]|uniref:Probable nicotinate-nucleotide adenylyltransferase n=1 Tax=Flavobacterium aurantiibacter TaxID=2023067 RepID=A0A256A0H7_9FLAO|nr:nicotinate (nicotinamide) nucleotide adenylyltransferase [Flavobacterium aurantiibacter]OYQ47196.1 nicotinic acid mononucleotide adenylyltransferase [Flavobacterium aurantiibacter]